MLYSLIFRNSLVTKSLKTSGSKSDGKNAIDIDAPGDEICQPNDECNLRNPNGLQHPSNVDENSSKVSHESDSTVISSANKTPLALLSVVATTDAFNANDSHIKLTPGSVKTAQPFGEIATTVKVVSPIGKGSSSVDQKQGFSGTTIAIIVGSVAGVLVLIIVVSYSVYKFRSRDEGTYKIDESNNYGYEACNSKPLVHLNGGRVKAKHKRKEVEWYV